MSEKHENEPLTEEQLTQVSAGSDGGFRRKHDELIENGVLSDGLLSDADLSQVSAGADGGFNRSIRPDQTASVSEAVNLVTTDPTDPTPSRPEERL
ncbi:MAG: hypothetical protein HC769_06015 [Cyanobacteria bacterium CRU_2_1]|nr:hypothetical protein [Cyanobacteria bacterium RU_5_0]NJR58444.1 hypothetical protein [Cyanobacteria bacterium CRU_2_1]